MLKLSRRGWNNVLIFVVLILMFVLYGIPERIQQQSATGYGYRLVPENTELLMVAFSRQRLIKAGAQWQLQPASLLHSADANQLATAWQHTQLIPAEVTGEHSRVPVAQASVQLAGQTEPVIWLLYPDKPHYLLQQAGSSLLFRLDSEQAIILFPDLAL
ncbi:hypothetical protein QE250_05080 [Chromatiaceae bacterium AAb-1]|nr:hypothetical protein [Chromatiaceae bacterium AAb-1]